MGSTARTRITLAASAFLLAGMCPAIGRAQDNITTINLTAAGPDKTIPMGSPFYLQGDADVGVARVQPIIVRKSTPWLFGGRNGTCSDLEKTLGGLKVSSGPNALTLPLGVSSASEAFSNGAGYDMFLPTAWLGPENGLTAKGTFKVLVPNEPSFFRTGGTYCLFVYKLTMSTKVDDTTVRGILLESAKDRAACKPLAEPDKTTCLQKAEQKRTAALQGSPLLTLDKDKRDKLDKAIQDLQNASSKVAQEPSRVTKIFESWVPPEGHTDSKAFTHAPPIAASLSVTGEPPDPLGRAIAVMLAQQGSLHPQAEANHTTSYYYYTQTGHIKVDAVGILADESLRVFENGGKNGSADLVKSTGAKVTTSDLVLPGSTLTLHDLLQFLHGRVHVGSDYLTASALRAKLEPILSGTGALAAADAATLDAVIASLDAYHLELQELMHKAGPKPAPAAPGARGARGARGPAVAPAAAITDPAAGVEADLGAWLRDAAALVPCDTTTVAAWGGGAACAGEGEPAGWPSYKVGTSPVGYLEGALEGYESARKDLYSADLTITKVTNNAGPVTEVTEFSSEFTQDLWVFSYLTPVTGAAIPLNPSERFSLPYVGLQLHFVPNLVDEPLWTNGARDLLRAFAIEVGMATTAGPWGTDGRFSGWKGVPPLFAGVALHLIPYTSLTYGATLMQKRASTVSQEDPQAFGSQYIGLNVQLNIPDLVVALKGRRSTATSSTKNGN